MIMQHGNSRVYGPHGRKVDYLAVFLLLHMGENRHADQERAFQVYVYYFIPVLFGGRIGISPRDPHDTPGIIDQDIYPAELLYSFVHHFLNFGAAGYIGLYRQCFTPQGPDFLRHFFSPIYMQGIDDNIAALPRKLEGDAPPHSFGTAGNNRHPVFE